MPTSVQTYRIEPGQRLDGELTVPGDKSISHRAVMLGAIARGTTVVRGFLEAEDCLATLAAFQRMGVAARRRADSSLAIEGVGMGGLESPRQSLDLGNSGTSMRLMLGLLAGQRVDAVLTGDASLRRRPMERIAGPLRLMGAAIETQNGCAPVRVSPAAALEGIRYELPVASAQIKSALLLAGLAAKGRTTVVSPAASRDHTERMLRTMGVALSIDNEGRRVALDGPAQPTAAEIYVPGDFSSAAFFIVGAALGRGGSLSVRGVGINPTRDGLLQILAQMGAHIELEHRSMLGAEPVADIRVHPGTLHGIDVPEALVPLAIDELPVLFVAAAVARGRTVVRGAAELRVKESDRLSAMARALTALGVRVGETPDGIVIEGGEIAGGTVASQGDHRIAMACAIAGLASAGPVVVTDTGPVATSFPDFVATAARAGLNIDVTGG